MTEQASPNEARASADESGREPDMARFLQDWSELWREEIQAQMRDPEGSPWGALAGLAKGGMTREIAAALELWRSAMVNWANISGAATSGSNATGTRAANPLGVGAPMADAIGGLASFLAAFRESAATPGTASTAPAPDARDAEIERLTGRVNELEARLAELEKPRRRRRGS
jgi:hypothetical protein